MKSYARHRVLAFDGAPAELAVRTPGTNKPTDRNHLMRYEDPSKTICGITPGSRWRPGIVGRTFCQSCVGLSRTTTFQTWTDGSYPRNEEE